MAKTLREIIKDTVYYHLKKKKWISFWSMSYCCWLGRWHLTSFERKRWND